MSTLNFALYRTAEKYKEKIKKYGITIKVDHNLIIWKDMVIKLEPYTPRSKCQSTLLSIIREAEAIEKQKVQKNQTSLL